MCPNFGLGKYGPIGDIFISEKVITSEFYFSCVKVNLFFNSLKKIQNSSLFKVGGYTSMWYT